MGGGQPNSRMVSTANPVWLPGRIAQEFRSLAKSVLNRFVADNPRQMIEITRIIITDPAALHESLRFTGRWTK